MSLENYLAKSNVSSTEIRFDFSDQEVEQLYNRVKALGWPQYFQFVYQHLEEVLKYISRSPSQRRQKKFLNNTDLLLLRLAALQISEAAVSFQSDISEIAHLVDRGSYRQFQYEVSVGIARLCFHNPLRQFPFQKFDDPFS